MEQTTRRRAARGTGSVYPVGNGRWRASVFIRDADAKRVRRCVSGTTETGVMAKLRTAQEDADMAAALAASPSLDLAGCRAGSRPGRCSTPRSGSGSTPGQSPCPQR